MIKIEYLKNDQIMAVQTHTRPTVYLDQWMWSLLAKDCGMRNAFFDTARAANATVMYSVASFLELGKLADRGQLATLQAAMDELGFGFIEINPVEVISREKVSEVSPGTFCRANPAVDTHLIDHVVKQTGLGDVPRISLVFEAIKNEAPERYKQLAQSFGNNLSQTIRRARGDPNVLGRIKHQHHKRRTVRGHPPFTRDLWKATVDFIVSNETMIMDSNEWLDVLHFVVPVSYLDFVLLDKRWKAFVDGVFPIAHPDVAQVFSRKEVSRFLEALAKWTIT